MEQSRFVSALQAIVGYLNSMVNRSVNSSITRRFVLWAGVCIASIYVLNASCSAQETATVTVTSSPVNLSAYSNISEIDCEGATTANIGNASASNSDGAIVRAYNVSLTPSGAWVANVVCFQNGSTSSISYMVSLGSSSSLYISNDGAAGTYLVTYGVAGLPSGQLVYSTGAGSLVQGANFSMIGWAFDSTQPSVPVNVQVFIVQDSQNGPVPFSPGTSSSYPCVPDFAATYLGSSPAANLTVPGTISENYIAEKYSLAAVANSGWTTTISTSSLASGHYYTAYAFAVSNGLPAAE